ncbi:cleavage and polyadenylation specificity factor subunit 3-like [Lytechinus variegatus]|uniref:cleavage and polyadenylation specificity factor subunit 3-like n=1 Tax=Lytechinus variegatus TaxID=7654 RepID=UPI001BB1DE48|nr:cleavage and polyadenylation specificity factor subunit 3-like [Lytechinus variegatus]XP_041467128.1 cleavage and polyadenylation specificity factor subunit 3-like [Lytechinus variegatus]
MAAKRKPDAQIPEEESDRLIVRPLGAGQEVGRSCIMLEFKGKKIMLDCGIHPGRDGMDSLPYFDLIDPEEIDLLLVSHFHLDHCGGLPYFLKNTQFRGRVFMTHASKAIYRWNLSDYVKVSNLSAERMLYTDADLQTSMDRIETVNFHQEVDLNGIRFSCFHAGHVLGACMFLIEIAGVKILYTGDFSRQEDRHLMQAELPNIKPDILITESTYGTHIHEKREDREARFTSTVHDIVNRGGRCLIPVFALGRAQELLLILDEYWSNHPELHDIPIYYASSLAKKCMAVYQTYIDAMNEKIRRQINVSNPFVFKHISNLRGMDHFDDVGPSVVMASPGMMQSGLSRELFENWCTDRRNGLIIAGYSVEGTMAKHVMSSPEEIQTLSGQKVPLKMSVDYISFSAHADYEQTSEFIRALKPPQIVLVHGEANEMSRLKAAILREYEDDDEYNIQVHNPRTTQAVELYFRGEKMAKVMGSLAAQRPRHNSKISGILVKRNFNYHIMAPSDLSEYTDLAVSNVTQRQSIAYHAPLSLLTHYLTQLSTDLEYTELNDKPALRIFGEINIVHDPAARIITLEWVANAENDMYADAVMTVVVRVASDPDAQKFKQLPAKNDSQVFSERLMVLLRDMFGQSTVTNFPDSDDLLVCMDGKEAQVNIESLEVKSEDKQLKSMVTTAMKRLHEAIDPVAIVS